MAVQYSIHKMVSDGTLSTIALGIQYLQRNDIYLRIAEVETPQSGSPSGYTWSFIDNNTIRVLPVVPAGVEVVVYRRTDLDEMYNIYSQNAQFDESTIDENNQQLLFIAQEYFEQGVPVQLASGVEYAREDIVNVYYRLKLSDGSYTAEFAVPKGGAAGFEALRRSYADAGLTLVEGSFETGGTLSSATDVLLHNVTAKAYAWTGAFQHVVAPGTNPTLPGSGYAPRTDAPRTDALLRDIYFTGPVRSLSQSQFAINAGMSASTQTGMLQSFIDSFTSSGGCAVIDQSILIDDVGLNARSNTDILFTNGTVLTKKPTKAPGYNLIRFDSVKNSHVYAPVLMGDKYTHLADQGEFGAGIAIVGECDTLHIHQPVCSSMWGDGIYVSKDTSDKYPLGVHIYQPKCDKNRRQGISIEGGVVRIYEPELTNTKSSDSRFTLANGPHAGIDIEPFDNTPVNLDVLVTSPKTFCNDGAGVMVAPYYLTAAKTLRIDVQNHVDEGSRQAFFLLGDNANFSGYIKYNGVGTLNKQNALHIGAWRRSINCLVDLDITARLWGAARSIADTKYGAAWAWDIVNGESQGGVNLKMKAIGPSANGSVHISYCIGSEYNDIDVQFTAGTTNNILACPNSNVRVKCLAANPPSYSGSADYTKLLTEFYINGTGDKQFAFESSYLGSITDGTEITVTARNVTSLALVRSASQASVGGYIYAIDGTKNGWKVTGAFVNFKLVKYGNDIAIKSVSGGPGVYA